MLASPQKLWDNPLVQSLALWAGFVEPAQLLLPATLAFAFAAVLAAAVRLLNLWLNNRLAAAIGSDISSEVYRRTLYQPYSVHVRRNSSTVVNTITNQVARVVVAIEFLPFNDHIGLVAIFLLVGLLLINWKMALTSAALFGSSYGLISSLTQRSLTSNSYQITASSVQLVKAVQEGLGAIRDVLLDGTQPLYQEIYIKADRRQRRLEAQNNFLAQFRYGLEAVGMVAIALMGWLLTANNFGDGAVIPLLGVLALSAQRMLPALQQAYGGWASLKAFNADLAGVVHMLPAARAPINIHFATVEIQRCCPSAGGKFSIWT